MEGKYTIEGMTSGKYIYRICLWKVKKHNQIVRVILKRKIGWKYSVVVRF